MNTETADLGQTLRVLGNDHRLEILYALAQGPRSATEISRDVGISRRTASRHLAVLRDNGLVSIQPNGRSGPTYAIDAQRIGRLNAVLFSIANWAADLEPDQGDFLRVMTPAAPDRCVECQNSSFVRQVLGDLEESLVKARDYQLRLRQMSSQVLLAQEEERKRIARELHDETAQALTSVLVRLRVLKGQVRQDDLDAALSDLRDVTAGTLEGVRRMATDLRPPALDDLGLEAALRSHADDLKQRFGLDVSLECEHLGRLGPDLELVVYRIVQEALSNVARHADGQEARVQLRRSNGTLRILVEDDGSGFDVESARQPPKSGLGIFGMEERASLLGGTLTIDSNLGHGTTVVAEIPLAERRQGY